MNLLNFVENRDVFESKYDIIKVPYNCFELVTGLTDGSILSIECVPAD